MCGIVGYIGKGNALPILIDGLKRLEYRGYDSAGIAFQNGKGIEVYRTKGKIQDLQQILTYPLPHVHLGLGHTRWATHGAPSTQNAHPQRAGGVVVVHNGIIENYEELKSLLIAKGYAFSSDTDTEVIPQMISHYLTTGLSPVNAIRETTAILKGTYTLGIMCEPYPDTLFAVKYGIPLVVALGEEEYFFASDIPALLPYTKKFIFLKDGQMCILKRNGPEFMSLDSLHGGKGGV